MGILCGNFVSGNFVREFCERNLRVVICKSRLDWVRFNVGPGSDLRLDWVGVRRIWVRVDVNSFDSVYNQRY